MKLIVGLGNPGPEYEKTLHNAGFMVVDQLASRLDIFSFKDKFNALIAKSSWQGEEFILMKPLTFMNNSGQAITACLKFFKIPLENTVVIYDDLDLAAGKARFRLNGGHGGHNGVRSTIEHVGSQNFKRVRLGIDRPPGKMATASYVLGPWKEPNLSKFLQIEDEVVERLLRYISDSTFENTSLQPEN